MAEMNCGASGKDPGVTGQCCKKSCQGQIQVRARAAGCVREWIRPGRR